MISQTGDSDIRDCKKVELGGWSIGVYRILPQFLHTQADQAPFRGYPGVIVYRSGRIDELQLWGYCELLIFKNQFLPLDTNMTSEYLHLKALTEPSGAGLT